MNLNQRVAMTRAHTRHPEGCVVKVQTAEALERRGLVKRPSPAKRPGWIKLSPAGLDWCEAMGW